MVAHGEVPAAAGSLLMGAFQFLGHPSEELLGCNEQTQAARNQLGKPLPPAWSNRRSARL